MGVPGTQWAWDVGEGRRPGFGKSTSAWPLAANLSFEDNAAVSSDLNIANVPEVLPEDRPQADVFLPGILPTGEHTHLTHAGRCHASHLRTDRHIVLFCELREWPWL